MEERVLKWVSVLGLALVLVVGSCMPFFPKIHEQQVFAQKQRELELERQDESVLISAQKPEEVVLLDTKIDSQLQLELPEGITKEDVEITNDYLTQVISIKIKTEEEDYFSNYEIRGYCDFIAKMNYYRSTDFGVVEFDLDQVCEVYYNIEENHLAIDLIDPHEIYDKVVVIDAGHGGRAAGAVKKNISEKDIDLAIALQLKEILDGQSKIGVYYTRLDDSNPSLKQRVALANKAKADLFVSIHNNASASGNFSSLNGTQVLYSESDDSTYNSYGFAQICLNNITAELGSKSIGLLKGDEIHIIRNSNAPVALVEVGFMTNKTELDNLNSPEYQKKAAQGIYNALLEAFEEGY